MSFTRNMAHKAKYKLYKIYFNIWDSRYKFFFLHLYFEWQKKILFIFHISINCFEITAYHHPFRLLFLRFYYPYHPISDDIWVFIHPFCIFFIPAWWYSLMLINFGHHLSLFVSSTVTWPLVFMWSSFFPFRFFHCQMTLGVHHPSLFW